MYGFNAMEVQEAFVKIREQVLIFFVAIAVEVSGLAAVDFLGKPQTKYFLSLLLVCTSLCSVHQALVFFNLATKLHIACFRGSRDEWGIDIQKHTACLYTLLSWP